MRGTLKEIGSVFFKLGLIAFGGPAAHIAMMEDEIITKRKWMSQQHFLDLIGATNLIPGPNSTEMTMHCGYERGGIKGLFLAGSLFILPAVVITLILAWLYKSYGSLPDAQAFMYGIKPAVIAIILSAARKLGQKALKNQTLYVLGAITLIASLMGLNEIIALFSCGILAVVIYLARDRNTTLSLAPLFLATDWFSPDHVKTFLTFLKVGALLYGSGYVLFAYLDAELVSTGLMTRQELIDAVAIGQITPGPVLSTATFIGYQLGDIPGAIAATVGIFLPSFIFVALLNPMIKNIRENKLLSSFLDGVNVGAVAIILSVTFDMAKESIFDWKTILIAVISLIVVFYFKKINSAYIVIFSAIGGYLLSFL